MAFSAIVRARSRRRPRPPSGLRTTKAEEVPPDVTVETTELGSGDDLGIGPCVTGDLTEDARGYIRAAGLPVRTLVTIAPKRGPSQTALGDADEAMSWARRTLGAVRAGARGHSGTVHVFMFAPASAALFLGTSGTASRGHSSTTTSSPAATHRRRDRGSVREPLAAGGRRLVDDRAAYACVRWGRVGV